MSWLSDVSLKDLDHSQSLEATCIRCLHAWLQSPMELLIKVGHRNVYLDEVADNLACPRSGCRNVGVRLTLVRNDDTLVFFGGTP